MARLQERELHGRLEAERVRRHLKNRDQGMLEVLEREKKAELALLVRERGALEQREARAEADIGGLRERLAEQEQGFRRREREWQEALAKRSAARQQGLGSGMGA